FPNEALSTTDRIIAMQYRVMATVLETIDHPADAVAPCKVCIEKLNGLPVVQQSLQQQLKTGIRAVKSLFNKERWKVISGVYLVNCIAHDITQTISVKESLPQWPEIDAGKERVDLLRDRRVREILGKQGMENCCVSWILGHDGVEVHGLNNPRGITTNSSGQYIVAYNDLTIKVFNNNGNFVRRFRIPPLIDDSGKVLLIKTWSFPLATDTNDNIYVLVSEESRMDSNWIFRFNKTADQHHTLQIRRMGFDFKLCKLSVSDSGKMLVLKMMVLKGNYTKDYHFVDLYETDGQFVCSFGEQNLKSPRDISTVSDGRVMVVDQTPSHCVHIFSELGDHLSKFDLKGFVHFPNIAFHRESQQVVLASTDDEKELLCIGIYTKDGEFVRSVFIYKSGYFLYKIAVSTEGRIA
ncbi:unnamed protein product, partial [Pocillopora meandrina]